MCACVMILCVLFECLHWPDDDWVVCRGNGETGECCLCVVV